MDKKDKPLKVAIKTFGCQMNEYDSEVAIGLLIEAGFKPASTEQEADVVIMNTCSVREHAEERVYGRLGMLGKIKKQKPELIVGLMGCMVEEHKEKLFKRFPQLDFMVGTRNISELPSIVEEVAKNRKQISKIKQDGISIEYTDLIKRSGSYHAWLPIMTGCDKVCTYCIVPITRGSEVSMPAREVYREASRLVGEGVQWITLLGQNVNSYCGNENNYNLLPPLSAKNRTDPSFGGWGKVGMGGNGKGEEFISRNDGEVIRFPQLLEMLCDIEGLKRISFTTSHPQDATEELFRIIQKNPKISRRFHLPLQSGSDRILKRMKRLHTYPDYKKKIDLMRELIPGISITTDIIAGFSGETEGDHQATVHALSEIRFDSAYIYKYSLRPATPAAKLPDDVPLEIKERRNHELLALQKKIMVENSRRQLGQTTNALVEEVSTKNPKNVIARTNQDKKVVFPGDSSLVGTFVNVRLTDLYHETFIGICERS